MMTRKITGVTVLGAMGVIALVTACGSSDTTGTGSCTPENAAGSPSDGAGSSGGGSDTRARGGEPSTADGGSNDGGGAGAGALPVGSVPAGPSGFTASNLP